MSYQLGAASRPRFSRVRNRPGTRLVRPPVTRHKGRMRRSIGETVSRPVNYGPGLSGLTRYLAGDEDSGLGFSLKPSKRLRKIGRTIKRNVTLKRALIGGAIVGAAFIPGVGPAALAAAKAAGRGAGRLLRATGRGLALPFRHKPLPFGPQMSPEDEARKQAGLTTGQSWVDRFLNLPQPSSPQPEPGGGGPSSSAPSPTYSSPPPDYSSGGSSGGGSSAPTPAPEPVEPTPPDEEAPEATMTTPAGEGGASFASALPILLGVGVVALLSRPRRITRRRAA